MVVNTRSAAGREEDVGPTEGSLPLEQGEGTSNEVTSRQFQRLVTTIEGMNERIVGLERTARSQEKPVEIIDNVSNHTSGGWINQTPRKGFLSNPKALIMEMRRLNPKNKGVEKANGEVLRKRTIRRVREKLPLTLSL